MNQFGGKRLVAAVIGVVITGVMVAAMLGIGGSSDTTEKSDRNVPGATTGAGKASLTD